MVNRAAATAEEEQQLLIEDVEFEEDASRDPYRLQVWWRFLEHREQQRRKKGNRARRLQSRYIIFERALRFLPNSYKLWRQYLGERVAAVEGRKISDGANEVVLETFDRALAYMHKMPCIWMDYLQFLIKLKRGTQTRRAFDRALKSLPVTQHDRIWPLYLEWAKDFGVMETTVAVYRRYLMYDPSCREDFVDFLERNEVWGEAAKQLAECVNDPTFESPRGHSSHQLWMRLCDMCARHPEPVMQGHLEVDAIIRSGISRFTDEVGRLWCKLADVYIRQGQFEMARSIYEEALVSVITVKDFTLIFDAYSQFEESVLAAKMEGGGEGDEEEEEEEEDDVELRLARLENLVERRPLLVSSVLLRQNPHNVGEWLKRIKLLQDDPKRVVECFSEAVKTVDAKLAVGHLSHIWIAFAKFYEDRRDLASARVILNKALQPGYRSVDELAGVWCALAEMEIRHEEYENALEVMRRATTEPPEASTRRRKQKYQSLSGGGVDEPAPVQERVHRSVRVWTLYLDLEESLGTTDTTRAAYERMLEMKIATPQTVLNYAAFLEDREFWEESFRAFEKGIALFGFPHVRRLWLTYLDKFIERHGGSKLERARELFEEAVSGVPAADAADFYVRYAKLEENHGLVRRAVDALRRGCGAVASGEQLQMYRLYISKVQQFFGVSEARTVYAEAIEALGDDDARDLCLEFARMEQGLGEIDRSRAILTHGSQFADPRRHGGYWAAWHDFEVAHGNEDTFREMLRVKRSVQMSFSNVNYMAAEMMAAGDMPIMSDAEALAKAEAAAGAPGAGGAILGSKRKAAEGGSRETDMEALEVSASQRIICRLVLAATAANSSSSLCYSQRQAEKIRQAKEAVSALEGGGREDANPEEIDLDLDEDAEDVTQLAVPDAVFGGLKKS
jgi:pre-mRNA-splicing factor SYF1